ncbi:MAG: galactose oxidase-like domain-containing protein [Pseudonocardiales bacterium]
MSDSMIRMPRRRLQRRNRIVTLVASVGVLVLNAGPWSPAGAAAIREWDEFRTSRPDYLATFGRWSFLDVPGEFKVNAVHAALLPTGKVLIIAGSGNSTESFEARSFTTLLWNPRTDDFSLIPTPDDMFCGGHTFLPDGKLLVAGGTRKYEVLEADVTRAAGPMTVRNESPDGGPVSLRKGTRFVSPEGIAFTSTEDATVPPAHKMTDPDGRTVVHSSSVDIWVEAATEGAGSVIAEFTQYHIDGVSNNVYGIAEKLTLEKQEYRGAAHSYEFDPQTERYQRVADMNHARWYPTLVPLADGNALAVSGLDEFGRILKGQNELYRRDTQQWDEVPALNRYFPTYPAIFPMADGRLFYSGSTTGWGPSEGDGRVPGIWNLQENSFWPVGGLREPHLTETSTSILLPPAQDQRVMLLGGGGIGESSASTARTDIVDLRAPQPHYTPGADLAEPTRYLNAVILPDDTVLTTGGSRDYRGKGASDNYITRIYNPTVGTFQVAASPRVGRNYHSEALLLPDGRVVVLGSDPLFGDEDNSTPGTFEQRIEIYSPPYLYHGSRPELTDGPTVLERGATAEFRTSDPDSIATARLIRPSAVTHATDVGQRSVALDIVRKDRGISLTVPTQAGLVLPGWYMLFVTDRRGTPSVAHWVQVR